MMRVIIASNSYHELNVFGPYMNKAVAEKAKEKFEKQYPSLDFLITKVCSGFMTSSKDNK